MSYPAAAKDPNFAKEALDAFGEAVVIGIDSRDGTVRTDGWTQDSSLTTLDFARTIKSLGGHTVVYTDISRDGALTGPNLAESEEIIRETGLDLVVSGGVRNEEDVWGSQAIGAAGVIVGKAYYEGHIDLASCFKRLKQ